jgi:hypothetical protein
MNALRYTVTISVILLFALSVAAPANAQVPVDANGDPVASYDPVDTDAPVENRDIPLLTTTELQDLVGPIALYPDDLLALVLPASTYPLQLVQAQRFLEDLEDDPGLTPSKDWDDSIIAILNYPEVVELLNEDLDWTWRLGEAVVAQQADVVTAVEGFRNRAYAAGNLQSDSHQTVTSNEGAIEITPVEEDVIYVPYYEPESVVVYQPRPVYYYYPRAYPVYYYPYPDTHAFNRGFFWGVTTAFTVGWLTDSVHVMHHSYHGHPYYGHHYWNGFWYRRPSIHIHNNYYSRNNYSISRHRYSHGDHWRPRHETRRRLSNQRITRSNYYANSGTRQRSYSERQSRSATVRTQPTRNSVRTSTTRRQSHAAGPANTRAARPASQQTTVSTTPRRTVQRANTPRSSYADRSQRQTVVQPRESRPPQVQRYDTRRSNNRGNERRAENRRERQAPAVAPREPTRNAERHRNERSEGNSSERRERHASRSDSAKRQRR